MCLGVYLASDTALPLVPWNPTRPTFNVSELEPFEASVRGILTRAYVYSLGSHTQCGCGFSDDEEDEEGARHESRAALAAYVEAALRGGPLDLYVCWNGDAAVAPDIVFTLTPSQLVTSDEWLAEGSLVRLSGGAV